MPSTMKKIALGALATAAVAAAPASAFTLYSQMPTQAIAVTATVGGASACTATGITAGASTLTVAWTGATVATDGSLTIKLCYDDSEIGSKPWRKYKDAIAKNKQCQQTVVESSALATSVPYSPATYDIEIPRNIAPAKYTVQVLNSDPTNGYTEWGETSCAFSIDTYERLPSTLVGTMSFLIAFSIVAGTAGYMIDRKKQNAAAAAFR